MWDLSKPGIEPMSPTLVDRYFTTEPPEREAHGDLSYSYLFPSNQYLFLPSSKHWPNFINLVIILGTFYETKIISKLIIYVVLLFSIFKYQDIKLTKKTQHSNKV